MKSIIGRKIGMTSVFAEDGSHYPVTVVEVLPNVVLQVKTKEKDGYEALQVGYEDKKKNGLTNANSELPRRQIPLRSMSSVNLKAMKSMVSMKSVLP